MKKIFLFVICFTFAVTSISAQDCMNFFPSSVGAMLINKTYNGDDDLLNTTIYRVENGFDYTNGSDMEVSFTMTDNYNNILSQGNIDASCMDGNFYLKMVNRSLSPEIMQMLGSNTELIGNFLDYPDTFNDGDPFGGVFQMDAGEYTLRSKATGETIRVKVYDRQYEKNERVKTPAGTFNAAKVSFNFECTKDGVTKKHRGVEWYAPGAGIVRSETYDADNNLENYTILTTLKDS